MKNRLIERSLIFLTFILFFKGEAAFAQYSLFPFFQYFPTEETTPSVEEEEYKKNINTGVEYNSRYYWRGQWFYGASSGVFFPYISYAGDALYLYFGAEIGESLVFDQAESNESGFGEVEKDWNGLDFGSSYSWNFDKDKYTASLGLWYFWYFRSPDIGNDGIDNSFWDLRGSLTFNEVFLFPTLSYSHYLRVDDNYAKRTNEDYYVTLSVSHSVDLGIPNASLGLGGTLNYWHYASQEESGLYGKVGEIPSGISDATFSTTISLKKNDVSYASSFNYAYVFDEKFDYTSGDEFDQNKFWVNFGVDYAF